MPWEYWLCIAASVALGPIFFGWMTTDKDLFRFNWEEIHHLYFGYLAVVVAAIHWMWWPKWVSALVLVLGAVTFADDVYEHHRQAKEPDYQSPLHRLFVWLWGLF